MLSSEDVKIIEKINKKIDIDQFYFSYNDVTQKEGIHNFARYPATMVPEMQKDILEIICDSVKVKNILDPFMGSGTVLVEGLKNGLNVYGLDVNPYAYFLTKSKITFVELESIRKIRNELINEIQSDCSFNEHRFNKIDKWFREDYQEILSKIRCCINRIEDSHIRLFFLIAFSDVITTLKNSQSSTFKLHIKKPDQIHSFQKDAVKEFINKVDRNISSYESFIMKMLDDRLVVRSYNGSSRRFKSSSNIACGDSRKVKELLGLRKNSIDLIVTSPPYGDNKTTVTYGQYSTLPLYWINNDEINSEFDKSLLDTFSAIDSASLGGKVYAKSVVEKSDLLTLSSSLEYFYNLMISRNREDKGRKVVSFIIDFYDVMKQLEQVLKSDGYMVFVVGNRRVDDELVPFDAIIQELLSSSFSVITEFDRLIKNKKMASKISRVGSSAVRSMDTETILIFKKK